MGVSPNTAAHGSARVFRFGHPGLWFAVAAALSAATSVLARAFTMHWGARFAVALLPIPAIVMLVCSMRYISAGLDELERRIQLEALATAFAVAAFAFITFNQLQVADLLGPEDWFFPWLAIWGGYVYGLGSAKKRYQ